MCGLSLVACGGEVNRQIRLTRKQLEVWADHLTLSRAPDGLLDITKGSREVTVSWCRFSDHNKTMTIGANPDHDRGTRVTMHHNFFFRTIRRVPFLRVRPG